MAYTIEQKYGIARAAQRVQSATEALTLTNNPSAVLLANFNAAVAALEAIVNPADPLKATVSNGTAISVVDGDGAPSGVTGTVAVANSTLGAVTLPGTAALVTNNLVVPAKDSSGTTFPSGTLGVVAGVPTFSAPATVALAVSAMAVSAQNNNGTVFDTGATVTVSAGKIAAVKLGATRCGVQSGTKITAPVTGSGTTGVTPTIVNGAITGFVLS